MGMIFLSFASHAPVYYHNFLKMEVMMSGERTLKEYIIEDQALQNRIKEIYMVSFESSDNDCAQDQKCYDDTSLREALLDPEYIKFVLFYEHEAIGFCLLTNNLKKARIAYCNDRFLGKKYPRYVSEGRLYYITAVCVLPEMQAKGLGIELLRSVCKFMYEDKAMVAYDYSENKNPNLTGLVQVVAKTFDWNAIEIPLDVQHYTSVYNEQVGIPD
jgi:ribosomal protein S18 acetylase RimI-like enzyme